MTVKRDDDDPVTEHRAYDRVLVAGLIL